MLFICFVKWDMFLSRHNGIIILEKPQEYAKMA